MNSKVMDIKDALNLATDALNSKCHLRLHTKYGLNLTPSEQETYDMYQKAILLIRQIVAILDSIK